MATIDEQFVEFIIKALVSAPDKVKIERSIDEKGVLLELTVDQEDLGRVIGKRGATAQSIRTLLRALGTKNDARYNLKIIDLARDGSSYQPAPATDDKPADDDQAKVSEEVEAKKIEAPAESTEETVEPEEIDTTEDDEEEENLVDKTRKELDELDDLDI